MGLKRAGKDPAVLTVAVNTTNKVDIIENFGIMQVFPLCLAGKAVDP